MKKRIPFILTGGLLIMCLLIYVVFFGSATAFSGKQKLIFIYSDNARKEAVLSILREDSMVKSIKSFNWLAGKMNYWDDIKPGRYKISRGMSLWEILSMLRKGRQEPVRLVINKLRLPNDLARVLDRALEADSAYIMKMLTQKDSLNPYGINDTNVFAYLIPDTHEVLWTWTTGRVIKKLAEERNRWWEKNDRKAKAAALGLTPEEVHILASIVEEETNKTDEKPIVASVYLNRLKKGMPLQADPTVRFALKDFSGNRVYVKQLRTPSPYNTYQNKGLPPGPICTPSKVTLDAVLNSPKTDYIFFVANADLLGGHTFTTNLEDHNKAANLYQDSLTAWMERKATREKANGDNP